MAQRSQCLAGDEKVVQQHLDKTLKATKENEMG
jgi:hypothetical protein